MTDTSKNQMTGGMIAEEVRQIVADKVAAVADRYVTDGIAADIVGFGAASGLVALACTFATTTHRSDCPHVRMTLHALVDNLLNQLIDFDAGRIKEPGSTIQ